jgi:hypothetical protein
MSMPSFLHVILWMCILTACSRSVEPTKLAPLPSETVTVSPTPISTSTPIPTETVTQTSTPTIIPSFTPTATATAFGGFLSNKLIAWWKDDFHVVASLVDGSHEVNITPPIDSKDLYPNNKNNYLDMLGWTKDGKWVLFSLTSLEDEKAIETLWAVRPDGSVKKQLFTSEGDISRITLHPDGVHFIMAGPPSADKNQTPFLCKGSIDGTSCDPIGYKGWAPQYSPDGAKLSWVEPVDEDYYDRKLMLLDPDSPGAEPKEVFHFLSNITPPDYLWLNNKNIVYIETKKNSSCEIHLYQLDKSASRLLVNLEYCGDYIWLNGASPDGRYVIYSFKKKPYILDILSPNKPIRVQGNYQSQFIWSPDGKLIELNTQIRFLDPQTGKPQDLDGNTPWHAMNKRLIDAYPRGYVYFQP